MTNVRVGTRADNLMSLLDGDRGAPVFTEVPTRPNGEQNACESYRAAQPRDPKGMGKKAAIQNAPILSALKQKDVTCGHQEHVAKAFSGRFSLFSFFRAEGRDEPIDA